MNKPHLLKKNLTTINFHPNDTKSHPFSYIPVLSQRKQTFFKKANFLTKQRKILVQISTPVRLPNQYVSLRESFDLFTFKT